MKRLFEITWFCIVGVPLYLAAHAIVAVAFFLIDVKDLINGTANTDIEY